LPLQRRLAVEVEFGAFQVRLLLCEGRLGQRDLSLVLIRLDLEQQLSLLDIGTVGKPHLIEKSGHPRHQVHRP
jgi:hypothetical protein